MTATHGVGTYGNAVGVVTPLDHKMGNLSLFLKTGVNVIRPGLFFDGNATVVSGTAGMTYSVRAFTAVTTRGATSGAVYLSNDGTLIVNTIAAPGANSRYDVVYAWPREFSIDGTNSDPVIGVVNGTAAASPTVPSLSAFPGAIPLAQILVPAGVTATNTGTTITQLAPFTAVDGGIVTVRSTTEMNAYTPLGVDDRAFNLTDLTQYRWSGAAWKPWDSDWISYTPTLVGIVPGTGGTVSARYKYAGGQVVEDGVITLGSSGMSLATVNTVSMGVGAAALKHPFVVYAGDTSFYDVSATNPFAGLAAADQNSTTTFRFYTYAASLAAGAVGTGSPFTWAAGDQMAWNFTHAPA